MKRALLIFVCVAANSSAKAQTIWCPPGAQWHFDVGWFAETGYAELTYVGDTIIDGVPCKQLFEFSKTINQASGQISTGGTFRYTYESTGVVFGYGWNGWDTLFNVNAVPGDRWGVYQSDDTSYVEVLDTGHNVIQGYNLKWMTVEYVIPNFPSAWPIDTIYERIGFTGYNYPFDWSVLSTDPYISTFCNYSDGAFSDWRNADTACRFLPSAVESIDNAPSLALYPNPARDLLYLKSFSPFHQPVFMSVFSLDGRKQLFQNLKPNTAVDIHGLIPGLYTVLIESHQGVYRQKFVKTSP